MPRWPNASHGASRRCMKPSAATRPAWRRRPYWMSAMVAQPDLFDTPAFSDADAAASGRTLTAGVDEAGRGPLAGPVYAAAVILDQIGSASWRERARHV